MPNIAILVAETDALVDGNYLRFANELYRHNHKVSICLMDSIALDGSRVTAAGFTLNGLVSEGDPFPELNRLELADFNVIWVLSLGLRHSFLDKVQLLYTIKESARIINSIDAIMHLKSKYFMASHPGVFRCPASYASTRPDDLFAVMQREGGRWIAKPPAGSFGRDVYLLTAEDPNARVILESMTGPEQDQYCLLQPYVEEIAHGEKRVLLAGGEPVGQYKRVATKDHRTNIMQGAVTESCELTPAEADYATNIGKFLQGFGAEYVGMDLAYPWVIEFNVINPGGILTIEQLTGTDLAPEILSRVLPEYS
ncbi:MAG: hypothetical protein WD356_11040 [Pseudomonadales bacterium]